MVKTWSLTTMWARSSRLGWVGQFLPVLDQIKPHTNNTCCRSQEAGFHVDTHGLGPSYRRRLSGSGLTLVRLLWGRLAGTHSPLQKYPLRIPPRCFVACVQTGIFNWIGDLEWSCPRTWVMVVLAFRI